MIRAIYLLLGLICLVSLAQAQPRASVSYAVFESAGMPYVEVYTTVERASLKADNMGQRSLEATILFLQGEDIKKADKVTFLSPSQDTLANFMEALRYPIAPGKYILKVEGIDLNAKSDDSPALKLTTPLEVLAPKPGIHLSDIQLVGNEEVPLSEVNKNSNLVKNGRLQAPLAGNFINRNMSGFSAYIETYDDDADPAKPVVLEYNIARIYDNNTSSDILRRTKRVERSIGSKSYLIKVATTELPSGSYLLTMTLRDKALQTIDQKLSTFQLANPAADEKVQGTLKSYDEGWVQQISKDSLDYVLKSLLPVASVSQTPGLSQASVSTDPDAKRLAIFNYFTDAAPGNAASEFRKYLDVVRQVDIAFQSGFGYGFQTDRGYIWLRYGVPNDRIEVNNDPSAPPYEIWVYNYVERTGQTPGKFLFYNPTLDNANYIMLHSNVRGEINEPRWKRILYSKSLGDSLDPDSVQGTDMGDNVGRYADQFFNDY